jgi:ABC-type multidrug transport system fused ATPase/permease subunit
MLLAIGMVLIGIRLSRNLHADIVGKLLKASFPKFYNVVMTGRLMNRLSKDIYNIDLLMVNELLIAVSFLL